MGPVPPATVPARRALIDARYFGLIELLLVFGVVFGWAGWQWWDWWKWKKGQEAAKVREAAEASDAEDKLPGP